MNRCKATEDLVEWGKKVGETMFSKDNYIAVFDSGVGGISVLRKLRQIMPGERYLYYGDCANAPYGSRPTDQVRALTMAAAEYILKTYPIKALVVACNTATAAAIEDLRAKYPELIIVGIEPAVKLAADHFPGGNLGVMATEVTLREEKFDALVNRLEGGCRVFKIPAPGLVPLIEAGKTDTPEMTALLHEILEPYIGRLDALVLGCTHYPFVSKQIGAILGPDTMLLHGGLGTAKETRRRLEAADLLGSGQGQILFITSSGDPETERLAQKLLDQKE